MAKETDKMREHLLYRFELLARREQDNSSLGEKWASWIYETASDYGTSIFKPVFSLIIVWFGFGLLYMFLFHPEFNSHDDWMMAFSVSTARLFPFGGFGTLSQIYADHINSANNPSGAHAFMYLATLQSIIATILLFLTALGIRRRFQIN
ncbi:hypothetical protein AEAC466_20200 [Asticcacaulis sp. AC466]|uniref:hypothetical protein n=1 Tax=Asticcacaulis sp. AC466 TaxID=1282362 RepID=UPI0003C403FD|nr:hypothetical protein [Asticcacaulis sp. AC466]ESQ81746.1 hypothetical protein AEAC466_20200 [Asticcacaulis sp. AC466]